MEHRTKQQALKEFRNEIQKKLGVKISERETIVLYDKYGGNAGKYLYLLREGFGN